MKNRILIGCGGVVAIVVLATILTRLRQDQRYGEAFRKQLDLARQEGLPTTYQEFAATISPAAPSENASPFYKRLEPAFKKLGPNKYTETLQPDAEVLLHFNPKTLEAAQKVLVSSSELLSLTDSATKFPRCWFDRDWTEGPAVLMPEYAYMKAAARRVALRGSVAAASGHSDEAIRNAKEIFMIAKHAGEQGDAISTLVQLAITEIGASRLAVWALTHPSVPEYRIALKQAVDSWPKVDVRRMYRDDLISILYVIDKASTPAGRRELGLKEDQVSPFEGVAGMVKNRAGAKTEIVAAERMWWKALELPPDKRNAAALEARKSLLSALLAFPTALGLLDALGFDEHNLTSDRESEARRRSYSALLNALASGKPPKHLDTRQWISPFDGKPIGYSWNGTQIILDARCESAGESCKPLKVPTDAMLHPKATSTGASIR